MRVERRDAPWGITYFLSDDGEPPERDDEAFTSFAIVRGGAHTEGLGREDHDNLLIDPTMLRGRLGCGDDATLHRTLESAVAAFVARVRAEPVDGPRLYAVFARADDGWATVVIDCACAVDDALAEAIWAINRLARLLGAEAVACARASGPDATVFLERRGRQHVQWCRPGRDRFTPRTKYHPFDLIAGGPIGEGWGHSDHDTLDGPRGA